MTIDTLVGSVIYGSPLSEDATYIDASGDRQAVKVLRRESAEVQLEAAEFGVRDLAVAFRLRIEEAPALADGEHIENRGTRYRIAAHDRLSFAEWIVYACA